MFHGIKYLHFRLFFKLYLNTDMPIILSLISFQPLYFDLKTRIPKIFPIYVFRSITMISMTIMIIGFGLSLDTKAFFNRIILEIYEERKYITS